MNNKKLLFEITLEEVKNLELDKYHTRFLTEMVVRKIRHPEEKMDAIASKTMKVMKKNYGKKNLVEVSSTKSLDQLEAALNDSEGVPTEWLSGKTVSRVVKKLAGKVIEIADKDV